MGKVSSLSILYPKLEVSFSTSEYLSIKSDIEFKREFTSDTESRIRKIYNSITTMSKSYDVNSYFHSDSMINSVHYPIEILSKLVQKRYIQQFFYLSYDQELAQINLRNVFLTGLEIKKSWEILLQKSLYEFSRYLYVNKSLDSQLLRRTFGDYNNILYGRSNAEEYPGLEILSEILDVQNPDIDSIKRDFVNTLNLSLHHNSSYVIAPLIGYFFLPQTMSSELLPILNNKLDRSIILKIYQKENRILELFENMLGLYLKIKVSSNFEGIPEVDKFYVKVLLLSENRKLIADGLFAKLFDFIASICLKLHLFKDIKLDSHPEKKVKVIKEMLGQENHFYSRILKIDVDDDILDGNVVDYLYDDPEILHTTCFENNKMYLVFVQKNIHNVIDLFKNLSTQNTGYEHSVLLEKIIEDNPLFKRLLPNDKEFELSRTKAIYSYLANSLSFYYRIFYFFNWIRPLINPVERYISQYRMDQLNCRMRIEEQVRREKNKSITATSKNIFTLTKERKREFLRESILEMNSYSKEKDLNTLLKISEHLTMEEIKDYYKEMEMV